MCMYLRAACLPLNVVENQTIVGRLCRLLNEECDEAFAAHYHLYRNKENSHSSGPAAATHNISFSHPPTSGGVRAAQAGKTGTPAFFTPSRAPCYESDLTHLWYLTVILYISNGQAAICAG
jgi:hypothetical protein